LNSIGLFKYVLLLSIVGLFLIVIRDFSKIEQDDKPKRFFPIFASFLLVYITIFICIKIDFMNHYQLESQICNQDICLFDSDIYLLRNSNDSITTLVITTNSGDEYEVHFNKNQYIKIAFFEDDAVSYSCADCASDFGLVVYRFIGGD